MKDNPQPTLYAPHMPRKPQRSVRQSKTPEVKPDAVCDNVAHYGGFPVISNPNLPI